MRCCDTFLYMNFLSSSRGYFKELPCCKNSNFPNYSTMFLFPQVLKFLARRRKCSSPRKHPKALSDEHRLSLQEKVNDYIKRHPVMTISNGIPPYLGACFPYQFSYPTHLLRTLVDCKGFKGLLIVFMHLCPDPILFCCVSFI